MLSSTRSLLIATAAIAVALALPGTASAGSYTVAQCNQALSPTIGQAQQERTDPSLSLSADCAGSGGLQISRSILGTSPAGSYGRWVWRAPTGTVFTGMQANATLVDGSGEQARLLAVGTNGQASAFGSPAGAFAPFATSGEFNELRASVACSGPASCPAGATPGLAVRNVLLQTEDRSAPTAVFAGGSLFASDAVRGAHTALLGAADRGGGVRRIELRVNDELVDDQILDCQVVGATATALQPCAGQAQVSTNLSTSEAPFATGVNQLRLCASDLAQTGQPNRGCADSEVFVDNLCPTSPVSAGTKLTARFSGAGKSVRIRSDRQSVIAGALTTDSGDGIGGAKICALTRVALPDEPYRVSAVAKTRGDGTYRLRLPAGASRTVFVDRALEGAVLTRAGLRTRAVVRPSFTVKPGGKGEVENGARLRFRGVLPGPACEGRIVKVQAKVGKDRWQVFRGIRTNDSCVYQARYKLRATSQRTRYLFRARVPEQPDYPFAAGSSTVRARVAGPE